MENKNKIFNILSYVFGGCFCLTFIGLFFFIFSVIAKDITFVILVISIATLLFIFLILSIIFSILSNKKFTKKEKNEVNNASIQDKKSFFKRIGDSQGFRTFINSCWCVLIGLLVGFIIMLFSNPTNACTGMMRILGNNLIFDDIQLKLKYLGQTLGKTAPLIIMSLAVIFAYKGGLFNIGGSGQFTIGVIFCLVAAKILNLHWSLTMLLTILGGMIWGVIPGLLKAYFKVNEVISCILLNWISLYLANWVLQLDPRIWNASASRTYAISMDSNAFFPTLGLDKIFGGSSLVGLGLIICIVVTIIMYFVINKTVFGYELKATGLSPDAARYAGMNEKRNIILTMLISGGLAGLSASLFYQNGYYTWNMTSNVVPIGFDGISSAFLGGVSPIGAIFSSYLIAHLKDGGSMLVDLGFNSEISNLVIAIIIYACGFVSFLNQYSQDNKNSFVAKIINKVKFKIKKEASN